MQAGNSGVGTGGSRYRKYNYPGVWDNQDFHTCRRPIKNYQDVQEVQNCELDGLAECVIMVVIVSYEALIFPATAWPPRAPTFVMA